MDKIKICKWIGTSAFCLSMTLNSFNVYPANVFIGLVGGLFWAWVGYKTEDLPLFLVDGYAFMIYVVGIIYYFGK